MSNVLLTKIEDAFDIFGRGIVVLSGFPTSKYRFDREDTALKKMNQETQ